MAYGLMAYRVFLDNIESLRFNGDPAVVEETVAECAAVADHDRWFEDEIARGEPTIEQALRGLLTGDMREDCGYVYGFALEAMCERYGWPLPNDEVCPVRGLQTLDDDLLAAGVTAPLPASWMGFDPPFPMPAPRFFPGVGTLRHKECGAAAAAYSEALPRLAESGWRDAARQIRNWFRGCETMGADLIVFYH